MCACSVGAQRVNGCAEANAVWRENDYVVCDTGEDRHRRRDPASV